MILVPMRFPFLISAIITTICAISVVNADEPIRRFETGGHSANCNWIGFTPDGQELVSVGSDKVIRIWNVSEPSNPVLDRTHRIQIGNGTTGVLCSAAIAPESDVLAVAGLFPDNAFLLIDLKSGEVLARVFGHTSPVRTVAFSSDGRYLVSSGDSAAIAVCDVTAWRNSGRKSLPAVGVVGHQAGIIQSTFVGRGESLRLISTSYDGTCRIWRPAGGQWVSERTLRREDTLYTLISPSPDGHTFALSCLNHQVQIFATNGQHLRTFGRTRTVQSGVIPATAFTSDGNYLVYGLPGTFGLGGSLVYEVSSGRKKATFPRHDNSVLSIASRPVVNEQPALIASTGGDANEIFLWNAETGETVGTIVGRGRGVFSVAVSDEGRQIAFGHTNAHLEEVNADHPLTHTFDLEAFNLAGSVADSWTSWSRRRPTANGWSARASETNSGMLDVYHQGEPACRIANPKGGRVTCYTFLPEGRSIVIGYDFGLAQFDCQTGRRMRNFVGHETSVWAVSMTSDGRTLFSASADQTIRVWDMEASPDHSGDVSPLLNLFLTADAVDWIAWTNEGYYTGSPGADELIGWHRNRKGDERAEFAAAWQYARVFRRPDIVSRVLSARSTSEAILLAAMSQSRSAHQPLDIARDQDDLAIPTVQITTPETGLRTQDAVVRVSGTVQSTGSRPVTEVRVLVNGRPASQTRGFVVQPKASLSDGDDQGVPFEVEAGLVAGENQIEVIAATDYAASQPVRITVIRDSPITIRPNLYVLGIGVASYANSDLNLSYPDDDVRQLIAVLKRQANGLYKDVIAEELVDEEVTDRNIRRALVELRRNVTQHDVAIVIISGHGDLADGEYFFCPYDHDPGETAVFGVRFTELTEPLSMMPCKVLLCLDTCHAAGVLGPKGQRAKATLSAVNRAVAEMTSIESGVVVMASSSGHQTSIEDDAWGHGAFALALIEAISGVRKNGIESRLTLPCDLDGDGVLEVVEIDAYVTARVKELTGGRQQPITERGRIPSFPIATVR